MVLFPCHYFPTHNKDKRQLANLRTGVRKSPLRPISGELACVLCRLLGIRVLETSVILEGHTKADENGRCRVEKLVDLESALVLELDKNDDSIQRLINLDSTGIRGTLVDVVERARESVQVVE